MPVYDNHAHLEIADGDEPLDARRAARPRGRGRRASASCRPAATSSRAAGRREAAASHPRVLAAVAIHPNEAPAYEAAGELDAAIAVIDELAAQPRVRAIGETGLDFFRTGEDGFAAQFRVVRGAHRAREEARHRDADPRPRRARRRPRDAAARRRARAHGVPLLLGRRRRWRGSPPSSGYYLSFAGNVTFKNAQNLRDALAVTPRERILVETDAPFLTPDPAPRAAERAVPRAADRALHGRRARRRPRRAVRAARREHARGLRRLLSSAASSLIDSRVRPFVSLTNLITKKIATNAKNVYTP